MKILMIAPEPIFEPRGTPMSVVGRLKALSEMGHSVDLLTYPIGQDIALPHVSILRISRIPGIRKVKIGPSFAKILLDFLLIFKTFFRLLRYKYDLIHTHEEAGFWGTTFSKLFRVPHMYDMHSSLPQQLENFQFSSSRVLIGIFRSLEKWVLRNASAVITICPDLRDHVKALFPKKGSTLIENVVDYGMIFGEVDRSQEISEALHLKGKRVALYTGTFEAYQGLDFLIESAKTVSDKVKDVVFLLVGGHLDQVAQYRNKVQKNGLEDRFIFTGQVSPQEVNSFIRCADVLLSPRISGTNTPLKIYAYLRSGVPIVATRLLTHTQVLSDDVAKLTEPRSQAFADGIVEILSNTKTARRLSGNAKLLSEDRYGYPLYRQKLADTMALALERGV